MKPYNTVTNALVWFVLLGLFFFLGMMTHHLLFRKQERELSKMAARVEKLEKLEPDLGDSMRELQSEMGKLWYAKKSHNTPLTLYELKEIKETVETVGILNPVIDRVNASGVLQGMINSQIAGMEDALKRHDDKAFDQQYAETLATCNECHRASGVGFNRITYPSAPPVGNQDWNPSTSK